MEVIIKGIRMQQKPLLLTLGLAIFSLCSGFTILSGPEKSTIKPNNGSTSNPQVIFSWDGSSPLIHSTRAFLGGKHANKSGQTLMRALIEEALDLWNNIPGTNINLALDTEVDRAAIADRLDLKNSIFTAEISSSSFAASALPNFSYNKEINPERDIVDCDIQIGTSGYSAENLAFTVAHEIGHCLGIGHNHLVGNAMMSYRNTEQRFELSADDKMAALFLYPSNAYADTPDDLLGCGVVGSRAPASKLPLALLMLLPLLFLRLSSRPL